jgi:hypothetical protein
MLDLVTVEAERVVRAEVREATAVPREAAAAAAEAETEAAAAGGEAAAAGGEAAAAGGEAAAAGGEAAAAGGEATAEAAAEAGEADITPWPVYTSAVDLRIILKTGLTAITSLWPNGIDSIDEWPEGAPRVGVTSNKARHSVVDLQRLYLMVQKKLTETYRGDLVLEPPPN